MKRSEWAEAWYQQAKHNLEAAHALRKTGFYETCAFICLLSAEWAVKALWLDIQHFKPPLNTPVDRLAESLGAPSECMHNASILVADESAMYPTRTGPLPFLGYVKEDANDRLLKAESIIAWVDTQWEHDDIN